MAGIQKNSIYKSDDELTTFYDKRDESYLELIAYHNFYELFTNDDKKCTGISIPETTLITNGGIKAWLFNSKYDPKNSILKKKQEKLTSTELINVYTKNEPKSLMSKRLNRDESRSKRSNAPAAYVIYVNGMSDLFNEEQFYEYATELLSNIKLVQKPLNIVSKADNYSSKKQCLLYLINLIINEYKDEIFLCEYRKDSINLPCSFKIYKKLHEYSRGEKNIASKQYKPIMLYKNNNRKYSEEGIDGFAQSNNHLQNFDRTKIYRSYDANLNSQIENLTKTLIEFIHAIYKIDIKKLIVKYVMDANGIFYFIDNYGDMSQTNKMAMNEFIQINKSILKKLQSIDLEAVSKKIKNAKFVIEKCHGDFCDYISFDNLTLQTTDAHESLMKKIKKKIISAEEEVEAEGHERKLPYEISYNLIKKVKDHIPEVKTIFKKFRIFPRAQAELYHDTQIPAEFDIVINIKKSEHDNFQTLYRFVKICKNCYPIYTCISRILFPSAEKSAQITTTMTNKSLIYQIEEQNKLQKKDSLSIPSKLNLLPRAKSRNDMLSESKHSTLSQKNANSLAELTFKNINTSFRIRPSTRSHTKSLEIQKNNMQRLALGVVTFSGLKDFYKEPSSFHFPLPVKEKKYFTNIDQNLSEVLSNGFIKSLAVQSNGDNNQPQAQQSQQQQNGFFNYEEIMQKSDEVFKHYIADLIMEYIEMTYLIMDQLNNIHLNHKKAYNSESIKSNKIKQFSTSSCLLLPYTTIYSWNNGRPFRNDEDIYLKRKIDLVLKERLDKSVMNTTQSVFHDEKSKIIRDIPYYKMNTNRMQMKERRQSNTLKDIPKMTFEQLCTMGNYEQPLNNHNIKIDVLIIDEQTAIPYSVITSSSNDIYKNFTNVLICHDFFGNYLNYIDYFQTLANKSMNLRLILFNIPGQAYTLYGNSSTYSNEYNANIIDQLLYELHENSKINFLADSLKFIGFGYGANIISCYMLIIQDNADNIKGCLLINPFFDIYDNLHNLLKKSITMFKSTPNDLPEMHNQYYSLTFGPHNINQEQAIKLMKENPIKPNGRICIFEGCINSINLTMDIKQRLYNNHIIIVHTLQNSIVNISHIYECLEYDKCNYDDSINVVGNIPSDYSMKQNNNNNDINNFLLSRQKRLLKIIDGTYSCFDENNLKLYGIINDFTEAPFKESDTAKFLYIERILYELEANAFRLQENEMNLYKNIKQQIINQVRCHNPEEESKEQHQNKDDNEYNAFLKDITVKIKDKLIENNTILNNINKLWNENRVEHAKIEYVTLENLEQFHKNQAKRIQVLQGYYEAMNKYCISSIDNAIMLHKAYYIIKDEFNKIEQIFNSEKYQENIIEFDNSILNLTKPSNFNSFIILRKERMVYIKLIKQSFAKLKENNKIITSIKSNNHDEDLLVVQKRTLEDIKEVLDKLIQLINNQLAILLKSVDYLENLWSKHDDELNREMKTYLKIYFKDIAILTDLMQMKIYIMNQFIQNNKLGSMKFNNENKFKSNDISNNSTTANFSNNNTTVIQTNVNKNEIENRIIKYQDILKNALTGIYAQDNTIKEYLKQTQTIKSFILQQ